MFLRVQETGGKWLRKASVFMLCTIFLVELRGAGKLFYGFQPLLLCGPLNKVGVYHRVLSVRDTKIWWQ